VHLVNRQTRRLLPMVSAFSARCTALLSSSACPGRKPRDQCETGRGLPVLASYAPASLPERAVSSGNSRDSLTAPRPPSCRIWSCGSVVGYSANRSGALSRERRESISEVSDDGAGLIAALRGRGGPASTSPVSGGPVALREGGNPYGKSGTPALAYMYPAGRGSAIPPSPHCPPAGLSVR